MKTLLASLWIFGATAAFADVVIYQGSQVVSTTSKAKTSSVVEPIIQVLDLTSAQMMVISLGGTEGKKNFSVAPPVTIVRTEVHDSDSSKRGFTIIARAVTETDAKTGATTVTNFLQTGANSEVNIKGTEKVLLPRNMQSSGASISTPGAGDSSAGLVDVKAALSLRDFDSRTCNDAGDSLEDAVKRITASLVAKGFTKAEG